MTGRRMVEGSAIAWLLVTPATCSWIARSAGCSYRVDLIFLIDVFTISPNPRSLFAGDPHENANEATLGTFCGSKSGAMRARNHPGMAIGIEYA